MVAHPEAEWIWWMDSDAVITDMEFEHPLEKYKDFNLVVHGWEQNVYKKRSWLGINAGFFL
jgi:xyloglucan 6-xylosyltransferase